jgi:D-alanyl-D-alanine carboxypeptidase/D-alanyl-D-alanine-endopeptidase (penicillin-binding protein 4)
MTQPDTFQNFFYFKKRLYLKILLTFLFSCFLYHQKSFSSSTVFENLKKLESQGAHISALVVSLNQKKVLAEFHATRRVCPASVSKLVLAAKSLETWGPDKNFKTKVFARGLQKNGTLFGDLIFYGEGDPALTNEKLWFLSTDIARYGLKEVTGKVIVNNSFFGKINLDENRRAGKTMSENAYNSPLSSSAVNFSTLALVIMPGKKPGAPATVALEPYPLPKIKITGKILTSKATLPPQISVIRSSAKGKDTLKISGHIPISSAPIRIYRSLSDPDMYAAQTFNAFLLSAGVKTSGQLRVESTALQKNDHLIAEVEGIPLDLQLRGLFHVSNNFIADMLTLQILHEHHEKNTGSLKEGGHFLENYVHQVLQNVVWKHPSTERETPLIIESGSGLTPNNRLSAQDIIAVLENIYKNDKIFPLYLASLPSPGGNDTLKHRFLSPQEKHLQNRLRAKTGTLNDPVPVSTLAGYSRLADGNWVAFAVLVNGTQSKSLFELKLLREAIDLDLAHILPAEL